MYQPGPGNHLFYGDNLDVLRAHIADESVDLIYLDPPFNSNADYNALFRTPSGKPVPAQEEAFRDTWQWDDAVSGVAVSEVKRAPDHQAAAQMLDAMVGFLGKNALTAYLAMMAVRLIELHRVLKPTGSLYLHCDPTASHYLKVLLDAVFGARNFANEVVWRRTGSHNSNKSFGRLHDILLCYHKSSSYTFNIVRRPYMKGHVESRYKIDARGRAKFSSGGNVLTGAGVTGGESCKPWRGFDPASKGRHWALPSFYEDLMDSSYLELKSTEKLEALYSAGSVEIVEGNAWPVMVRYLEERDGMSLGDIWAYQPYTTGTVWGTAAGIDEDVKWLGPTDPERLGYPTQKPVALLERIIAASSNPGDTILDPFCGCGTTVHAAQKLGRRWMGIDITHVAIGLIETRLRSAFPGLRFTVHGTPMDLDAARDFFARDDRTKKEFEKWAVTRIGFLPQTKKGADGGLDGMRWFGPKDERKAVVSVKGGKAVSVETVRSPDAVVKRQGAEVGVLLSLEEPTQAARDWARQGGLFALPGFQPVPRLQVVTVAEALEHRERAVRLPALAAAVRSAPKEAPRPASGDLFG